MTCARDVYEKTVMKRKKNFFQRHVLEPTRTSMMKLF